MQYSQVKHRNNEKKFRNVENRDMHQKSAKPTYIPTLNDPVRTSTEGYRDFEESETSFDIYCRHKNLILRKCIPAYLISTLLIWGSAIYWLMY